MTVKITDKPVVIPEPTDVQRSIAKAEKKLVDVKHIDAKEGLLSYVFPILRKLAISDANLIDDVTALQDAFDDAADAQDEADAFDSLTAARDQIVKLALFIDQLMVMGQWYSATEKGLEPTTKVTPALSTAYAALQEDTKAVVFRVQETLANAADDGDDEDDGGDAEDDDGEADEDADSDGSAALTGTEGGAP